MYIVGLNGLVVNFVRQTTFFTKIASRKEKFLVSSSTWKDAKDDYLIFLKSYKEEFSKVFSLERVKESEEEKLITLLLQRIQEHIVKMENSLEEGKIPFENMEGSMSLIYSILLISLGRESIPIHFFTLSEEEMLWYLQENLDNTDMLVDVLRFSTLMGMKVG